LESWFSQVLSIIAALLLLSLFVMVHELGHYGVGRLLGFKIQEFAIGMGPKLFGVEKKGILYAVRAFPIGGMCRFYGEDEEAKDPRSFGSQKTWKRFLVILAGPVMNLLFAFLFAVVALTAYGDIVPAIHSITEQGSPADVAGMQPGDILYAVDGARIEYYEDAVAKIRAVKGTDTVVTVIRDGKKLDIQLHDIYNAEAGYNIVGVNLTAARLPYGLFEAIGAAFPFVGSIVGEMFSFLGGLFTKGVQQGDVLGPVGTITYIGYAVRTGFETVLRLAVLISVNLAIINLLPLPALDGGRLAFLTVEGLRGKPIPQEKEGMVHFVGIVLLFALIIVLTFNDIRTMFGG
jgi:regulator of sigma E protease